MSDMDKIYELAKLGDLDGIIALNRQFKINDCDKNDKYTPLMWAAKRGHLHVVQYLTNEFSTFIELDKKGGWNESTALMKAAESNHVDVVKQLAEVDANINLYNDFKSTALMLAAEKGFVDVVRYLMEKKALPNLQNELGYTAMILASEYGHSAILQILCDGGANTEVENKFGKTAIIMAAEMNHIDSVSVLLQANANKDHKSKRGKTALMLATLKGSKAIVELLLKAGAKVNIQDKEGESALINSFHPKDISITKLLLSFGADVKVKDKYGCTPLMIASRNGRLDIVVLFLNVGDDGDDDDIDDAFLLAHSGDVNARSNDGSMPVHFAAAKGHLSVVTHLIKYGADLRKTNHKGATALDELAKYYANADEKKFKDFVRNVGSYCELFETLPDILANCKSPNTYMNSCFSDLMYSFKIGEELDVVTGLIYLAVGISLAAKNHPREAEDLKDRLEIVNKILLECLACETLSEEDNVAKVFKDRTMRKREAKKQCSPAFSRAITFVEGPLYLCIKHELLPVLGTRTVSTHVDKVFWGYITERDVRKVYTWKDLFQMRTNAVFWRTCPAAYFFSEGVSKVILLLMVAYLAVVVYEQEDYQYGDGRWLEISLFVMLVGHIFHEIGELHDCKWDLSEYFDDIWNYMDIASFTLQSCWAFFMWKDGIISPPVCISNVGSPDVCEVVLPFLHAREYLVLSAIPMSLALLRYLSTFRELLQLVLMYFAMIKDLGQFVVVFIINVLGFGIAFRGLFPKLEPFTTTEKAILTLFDATLGQHDFSVFIDDRNHYLGVGLYVVYISLTMIVLLNLVIARFSATHDEVNERSTQVWPYLKAKFVHDFVLIEETSPFSMLPPPLNLVSVALMPIHYLFIHLAYEVNDSRDGKVKTIYDAFRAFLMRWFECLILICLKATSFLSMLMGKVTGFFGGFVHDKEGRWRLSLHPISDVAVFVFNSMLTAAKASKDDPKVILQAISTILTPVKLIYRFWKGTLSKDSQYEDNPKTPCTVLSVSGTASDMLLSLVLILPCALFEIRMCLMDIHAQVSSMKVYYACITLTVLLFPLVLLVYIVVLLVEIANVRSVLEIDETGKIGLNYEVEVPRIRKSTKDIRTDKIDKKIRYTQMMIKVLRAEYSFAKDYALFSKPSLYCVFRVPGAGKQWGDQELVTKKVESLEMTPSYFENKMFYIFKNPKSNESESDTRQEMTITLYDNYHRVMGMADLPIERWIANGRFEGALDLHVNGVKTGTVQVDAKVIPRDPAAMERTSSRLLSNQERRPMVTPVMVRTMSMVPPVAIFSEDDRKRIFHGVTESSASFAKNPLTYEITMRVKDQLQEMEDRLYNKALSGDAPADFHALFAQITARLDAQDTFVRDIDVFLRSRITAMDDKFEKLFDLCAASLRSASADIDDNASVSSQLSSSQAPQGLGNKHRDSSFLSSIMKIRK